MSDNSHVEYVDHPHAPRILTPEAVDFLVRLHRRFEGRRRQLLGARAERMALFTSGERPGFLPSTAEIRQCFWQVAAAPPGLVDRRVEITGPVDRKMMINALNSGAQAFMADFEDANAPTWDNVVQGQVNLCDAVAGTISWEGEARTYALGPSPATLMVRPRGWHLVEKHFRVDGDPIAASLFDFGLYLFHNARPTLSRGFGPYFYLPKLENHLEARLWEDVITEAERALGLGRGTARVTVLIETITAAFEMEEILYELRHHICGLNAGRWDYIFSIAKQFHADPAFVLPDRAQVTMTTPFMRAYTELLVKTCHRRGAHAIGGMAAFVPNRRKPDVTRQALARVAEDKKREAADGFDGTWVAHPDLVGTAMTEFDAVLGDRPNQLGRQRPDVCVGPARLLEVRCPNGGITSEGLATNISVALRYLCSWLSGVGAAALDDMMEDAATAEICRAQVWQWAHHGVVLSGHERTTVSTALVHELLDETVEKLVADGHDPALLDQARAVFEQVTLADEFPAFLTIPAYELVP